MEDEINLCKSHFVIVPRVCILHLRGIGGIDNICTTWVVSTKRSLMKCKVDGQAQEGQMPQERRHISNWFQTSNPRRNSTRTVAPPQQHVARPLGIVQDAP
jgi:hypothetical protein